MQADDEDRILFPMTERERWLVVHALRTASGQWRESARTQSLRPGAQDEPEGGPTGTVCRELVTQADVIDAFGDRLADAE